MSIWIDKDGIKHPVTNPAWCGNRYIICRRCGAIMKDYEPDNSYGEFFHSARTGRFCQNNNSYFTLKSTEIEPFLRKRDRRSLRRGARLAFKSQSSLKKE